MTNKETKKVRVAWNKGKHLSKETIKKMIGRPAWKEESRIMRELKNQEVTK